MAIDDSKSQAAKIQEQTFYVQMALNM